MTIALRLASDIYFFCYGFFVRWDVVMAAQSIANIVKSSLGPLGLDKMLVDNIGVRIDIFI